MKKKVLSKYYYSVVAVLAALLCLCLWSFPVRAAEGFRFYTDNPGIHVTAGDSLSFDLHL